tara:strand:- start:20 stop:769 length:750 start_codon:yes stop_codon:yes gene_type:complete
MKVGICQFDIAWEDKEKNKKTIESLINSSSEVNKLDWMIFPEMTLSGFSMNYKKTKLDNDDITFFSDIALHNSTFITFGGSIDRSNCSITMNPKGQQICVYKKIHLISYYGEEKAYKSGTKIENFVINNFKIMPTICYDLRFSYLYWDNAFSTSLYVVIANWPSERDLHWKSLLKARAIENQSYVIGVNRIGKDLNTEYLGNSLIISPNGEIILDSGNSEGISYIDIDRIKLDETRKFFPFLDSRKVIQ